MNFKIVQFLKLNLPEFNPEIEQDLIRGMKILKAESKLNGTFTNAEIEDFLLKVKNQKNDFSKFLKFPTIQKILKGEIPDENDELLDLEGFSQDEIDDFAEYCSASVLEILQKNVKENQSQKLDFFVTHFSPIISFENHDELFELLREKNNLLIRYISEFTDLEKFKEQFPFSVDENYYELLSTVDAFSFGNQLMNFTTAISERQNTHEKNKKVLGEIVSAMSHFQAFYEEQKQLFESNRKIGAEWTKERNSLVGEFAKNFSKFLLNENNFTLSLFLSFLILVGTAFLVYFIKSFGTPKLFTFVFILVLVTGFSFGTISKNLQLFKRDFFPYYFIKFSGSIFLLMCVTIPIFLLLAVVFEMSFSFKDKTNFGGALIFPIVYLLLRFFNRKK